MKNENQSFQPLVVKANARLAEVSRNNEMLEQRLKDLESNPEPQISNELFYMQKQLKLLQDENKFSNEKITRLAKEKENNENSLNEYRSKLNDANRINNELHHNILSQSANKESQDIMRNYLDKLNETKLELERYQNANQTLLNERKNLEIDAIEKQRKLNEALRTIEEQKFRNVTIDDERNAFEQMLSESKKIYMKQRNKLTY